MSVTEKDWGQIVHTDDGDIAIVKDRRGYVLDETFSLDTGSLVGSSFLAFDAGQCVWQGVVVGEPQAGRYLCEIDKLEEGVEKVQRLFSLDVLMGLGEEARRPVEGAFLSEGKSATAPVVAPSLEFRFYDHEEAAREAYAAWARKQVSEAKDRVEV